MRAKMSLIFASGVVAGSFLFGGGALAAQNYWRYIKVMNENLKLDVNGVSVPGANLLDYNQTVYAPVNAVAQALGGTALWSKWLPGVNLVRVPQMSAKSSLVLEGQAIANTHPILLNGTAYVPASVVAKALAVPQNWNAKTQTEYFGPQPSGTLLTSALKPYYSLNDSGRGSITTFGNIKMSMGGINYYHGIQILGAGSTLGTPDPVGVYYNLQGRYTTLSGLVGIDDSSQPTNELVSIFGNGKQLFSTHVREGELPQKFDVNVSGVHQLKLLVEGTLTGNGQGPVDFANVVIS